MAERNFNVKLSRFASTSEQEKKKIMEERNSSNTNKATQSALTTFREYLTEKQIGTIEEVCDGDLPKIMLEFYTNLRKIDGGDYCVQSMKCIRAGINRYFKAECGIDIIDNEKFTKANEMFCGVNKRKRAEGKGSTKSTSVICPEDMQAV